MLARRGCIGRVGDSLLAREPTKPMKSNQTAEINRKRRRPAAREISSLVGTCQQTESSLTRPLPRCLARARLPGPGATLSPSRPSLAPQCGERVPPNSWHRPAPSATVYLHRPLIRLVRKVSRARPGLAAARRPGRARGHCLPSPAHHRAIRPTWRGMWPSTAGSAPPPPPSQRTEALHPIGCRHQFCMVSPRATLRVPRHDGRLRRRQMPAPCRIGCRVGGVTVVWAQQRRRSEKARRHWRNQCPAAGAGAASLFKAVQIVGPSPARRSPAL
jgi:hypothetical protein